MKKPIKRLIIIAVVVVLVVICCAVLPGLIQSHRIYSMLQQFSQQESAAMDLTVEICQDEKAAEFTARLESCRYADQTVMTITREDVTLSYCQGAVILPNGQTFRLEQTADDSITNQLVKLLLKDGELQIGEDRYVITLRQEAAETVLRLLWNGEAPAVDLITLELMEKENSLSQISVSAEGMDFFLQATLVILEDAVTTVPAVVQEALDSGAVENAEDISREMLELLSAWACLPDPLTSKLTISVDCGLLTLQDEMTVCRRSDPAITAVRRDGYTLYFSDTAVCDEKGNSLTISSETVDPTALMDLIWQLCLNSRLEFSEETCTMTLGEESLAAVANAIAPQAAELDITYSSGSIVMQLSDGSLQAVSIRISGTVPVLFVPVSVSVGAEMTILDDAPMELPAAVLEKLG